jgi:hypothetical protein
MATNFPLNVFRLSGITNFIGFHTVEEYSNLGITRVKNNDTIIQ